MLQPADGIQPKANEGAWGVQGSNSETSNFSFSGFLYQSLINEPVQTE